MAFHEFEETYCVNCAIRFLVPSGYVNHRRRDKRSFFCPNGHGMSFRENEEDKLRRERDRLTQQLAQKEDEISSANRLRDYFERQSSARKGQLTRLKNRAAAGVCPCCNRSFENLRRHMGSKHPDFKAEEVE